MENFVQTVLYPAIGAALSILVGLALDALIDYLKRKSSSHKYLQAAGIVLDSMKAALNAKLLPSLQAKLSDGKLTDAEYLELKDQLKGVAQQMAKERLLDLRGFIPKDINKWLDLQLEVALGELLGPVFPGEALVEKEGDPLADTPAYLEDSK